MAVTAPSMARYATPKLPSFSSRKDPDFATGPDLLG